MVTTKKTTTDDDYNRMRRASTTTSPPWWPPAVAVGVAIAGLLVASTASCSSPSTQTDSITRNYIALVRDYHDKYVAAQGAAYDYCIDQVDPSKCRERGMAMVAVHEKFLRDLNGTPAPPRFAADDSAIRTHLPDAITDLEAMISAAEAGDKSAVLDAAANYIHSMIPTVTSALHDIDPRWPNE